MTNSMEKTVSTSLSALKNNDEIFNVGMTTNKGFDLLQRVAKMMASSTLVPKEFQNNISNCAIAVNMAYRIGADPLMVIQNLYIIHGRPSWSSQFLISTVNTCGKFSSLKFEFFGDPKTESYGCRAFSTELSTDEKLVGSDITIGMAMAEGWYQKSGSKWKTMPQQMLMYRAASWWARVYAPELSMGLRTAEEEFDIVEVNEDGSATVKKESFTVGELKTINGEVIEEEKRQLPEFTVEQLTEMLVMAKSIDALEKVMEDFVRLTNDSEKEKLMDVYEKVKSGLHTHDGKDIDGSKTLEPKQKTIVVEPYTVNPDVELYDEINSMIHTAKTTDELDLAADRIRGVKNKKLNAELTAFYTSKRRNIE